MNKKLCLMCAAVLLAGFSASTAWSAGYSVRSSVESTLQFHRQLKSIQENRQAAVHDVRRAQAGWLPKLDANAGAGGSYSSTSSTRTDGRDQKMYGTSNAGVTLTQPLWDGLATKNRVDIAEFAVSSLDYRVVDNATTLALDAIIAHANVVMRRQLLQYAHENVKQHQNILDAQNERASSGTITVADVTQVQGRLARARSQLAEAQGNLRQSEENYFRVTGVNPSPNLENIAMPTIMYKGPDPCFDEAQKQNPKLLAYFEDTKKANSQQSLAKSAYQPTVNFEARANGAEGGPAGAWTNSADAMVVMRWNLYNGGGDLAAERVAAAQYRQSREDAFNLNDTLKQEVYNAWTQYTTAQDLEKFYSQAIDYNIKTRNGFMEQFLIGQRSLLDVLDASSEYFNSSTQWAIAKTNRHIAAYTMYALAGGLLQQFSIDSKALLRNPS